MEKFTIDYGETHNESDRSEGPDDSSFIENFKRQNKVILLVAAFIIVCISLFVATAFIKDKAAKQSVQKAVPENESTRQARKVVEVLRQIPRKINPDQDHIAETLDTVCTSAKKEFDKINPTELEIDIRSSLLGSFAGCWSAINDARDPLVVPEDIEDIPRTLKYKEIRDKSFRENMSKFLGERENVAKKLGM